MVTSYYWDNAGGYWVEVASFPASGIDFSVVPAVWSHDYAFTDQDVRIAFDNFQIDSGTIACHVPAGQLAGLDNMIDYFVTLGGVSSEVEQALTSKVDAARAALLAGNPNAAKVALNDLAALIRFVEAQTGQQITDAAAQALIGQIHRTIDTIMAM
jgi:hypothetical protein